MSPRRSELNFNFLKRYGLLGSKQKCTRRWISDAFPGGKGKHRLIVILKELLKEITANGENNAGAAAVYSVNKLSPVLRSVLRILLGM